MDFSKMKVPELKDELEKRRLSTDGLKSELLGRLMDATEQDLGEDSAKRKDFPEDDEEDQDDDEDDEGNGHARKRRKDDDDGDEDSAEVASEADTGGIKFCVKIRGLPWSADAKAVTDFFKTVRPNLPLENVQVAYTSSGDGWVELDSEAEVVACLTRNRQSFGKRYVEVFRGQPSEMHSCRTNLVAEGKQDGEYSGVVRVRGLPWAAKEAEVKSFFDCDEGDDAIITGVHMGMNKFGKPSGECLVVFSSIEHAMKALGKNKQKLGERWLDVMPATKGEVYALHSSNEQAAQAQQAAAVGAAAGGAGGAGGGGGGAATGPGGALAAAYADALAPSSSEGGDEAVGEWPWAVLRMRGLPFSTSKADVIKFFNKNPTGIPEHANLAPGLEEYHIFSSTDVHGRFSGEAFVLIKNQAEAKRCLVKNKEEVEGRWVELFVTTRVELYNRLGVGCAFLATKKEDATQKLVVRVKGLPFNQCVNDIRNFFTTDTGGLFEPPVEHGIFILTGGPRRDEQRPTGEALVLFGSVADAEAAALIKNQKMVGERTVDCTPVCKMELYVETTKCAPMLGHTQPCFGRTANTCVRLKGLPFGTADAEVHQFFDGLSVVGLFFLKNPLGRNTGEAFVEFADSEQCSQALARNREHLNDRYLELFSMPKAEVKALIAQASMPQPNPHTFYGAQGQAAYPPAYGAPPPGAGGGGYGGGYGGGQKECFHYQKKGFCDRGDSCKFAHIDSNQQGGAPPGGGGGQFSGDWSCPNCGANVFASKFACFKCHTPKPQGGPPPGIAPGGPSPYPNPPHVQHQQQQPYGAPPQQQQHPSSYPPPHHHHQQQQQQQQQPVPVAPSPPHGQAAAAASYRAPPQATTMVEYEQQLAEYNRQLAAAGYAPQPSQAAAAAPQARPGSGGGGQYPNPQQQQRW